MTDSLQICSVDPQPDRAHGPHPRSPGQAPKRKPSQPFYLRFAFCAFFHFRRIFPDVPIMTDSPATRRWFQICSDPAFADRPERIEIDAAGELIMSRPPGFDHRQRARAIANLLDHLNAGELGTVEQAILTCDGQVRIADVLLLTFAQKRWLILNPTSPLPAAPPVCVEILSRSNTQTEIDEKRALYFDAGATEVWICNLDGTMSFFSGVHHQLSTSLLCPAFPQAIS